MFIYHPGTGTMIPIDDEVYIIDPKQLSDDELQDAQDGTLPSSVAYSVGWKLGNYNMIELFRG